MGDHGIKVPRADERRVPRLPHTDKISRALPVWLCQNSNAISVRLQNTPDDGRAEAGVVHIRVTRDEQEIIIVPATIEHILA